MKLVSVAQMQKIEREADARGHTYEKMMQHAGTGLAEVITHRYQLIKEKPILGLVGSGNNGGDTLVALARLAEAGWNATAYIVLPRDEDDPLIANLSSVGGNVIFSEEDSKLRRLTSALKKSSVVMDGVFGTGIHLPLRDPAAKTLKKTNQVIEGMDSKPAVVAVDCPSGIDCESGEVDGDTICADLTVTMAAVKIGMLNFPAYSYVGDIVAVGIGLKDELKPWKAVKRFISDAEMIKATLPSRPLDAHKGTFGTALIVAGSTNYTGAVLLAGEAAYRIGAGLVTLAVPYPLHAALAGHSPESTWLLLPHEMGVVSADAADVVFDHLDRVSALLIGPGFGLEDTTREFIAKLLEFEGHKTRGPLGFALPSGDANGGVVELPQLIFDADGLKLLSEIPDWYQQLPPNSILTPHPGEMSILTGLSKEDIQADRLIIAERFAKEWNQIIVLKGALTVIASPDGRTVICPIASPALARAGTGDVLAGMIVGLCAQGMDAFDAAYIGVDIHARAGLLSAEIIGHPSSVIAGDLLKTIPQVIANL